MSQNSDTKALAVQSVSGAQVSKQDAAILALWASYELIDDGTAKQLVMFAITRLAERS